MAGEPEKTGSFEYIVLRDLPKMAEEYRDDPHFPSWTIGNYIPVARCAICESRYTKDPTRDEFGHPLPDHYFASEEHRKPVCWDCTIDARLDVEEAHMMEVLEEKLGLTEKDRDALRSFIQTIFTDPEKILKLERVNNRLESLEREVSTWKWVSGITAGFAVSAFILAVNALAGS